jgi:hypothetical protein
VTVALGATAIVILALLWEVSLPWLDRKLDARRARRRARQRGNEAPVFDPGRERRAEQRARELLKSCVSAEEWAMYRDLGFIRVWGQQSRGPYGSARLPDSDDVLAKWMALTGDERRLIATANMHLPGRQVDPRQVQRDIWRLGRWERERLAAGQRAEPTAQ